MNQRNMNLSKEIGINSNVRHDDIKQIDHWVKF